MWKSSTCRSGMNLPLRSRTLTGIVTSVVSMRTASSCAWPPPCAGGFSVERSDTVLLLSGLGVSTEAGAEGAGLGAVGPTLRGRVCGDTICTVIASSGRIRIEVVLFMAVTLMFLTGQTAFDILQMR